MSELRLKRRHWLAQLINDRKFTDGAEVGAATGITTLHLLFNCRTLKKITVADDWRPVGTPGKAWAQDDMEEIFRGKFGKNPKVRILKGLSWDMASFVDDNSLDFVFVDASHDYESVKKDLEAWTPKVKPGGVMCGHDIHSEGVKSAVEEKFGSYEEPKIDQVWFVQL